MKVRPITMTGPSPTQILDGIKTQTRRLADPDKLRVEIRDTLRPETMPGARPLVVKPGRYPARIAAAGAISIRLKDGWLGVKPGEFHLVCPYADGDTYLADNGGGHKTWTIATRRSQLWVREGFAYSVKDPDSSRNDEYTSEQYDVVYRASAEHSGEWTHYDDELRQTPIAPPWRSPRFMPRWASRILLDVALVRLDRLQNISARDMRAEGVTCGLDVSGPHCTAMPCLSLRTRFQERWNDIHGPSAWADNPWVWAVTYDLANTEAKAS